MNVQFEVPERSTAWLTVSFLNRVGDPETPTTITYEIWDVTSGTSILAETSLTPNTQVEITLSSEHNRILDSTLFREARKVIVVATYGAGQKHVQDFVYHIRNIAYRTT